MLWTLVSTILKFAVTAPFLILGFLLIPVDAHSKAKRMVPPWFFCWANVHDFVFKTVDGDQLPESEHRCRYCKKLHPGYYM